ncbi:MAG: sensor domain-containing diguanylate cyclase, partial [Oscillospiraceae bacterium]
VIFGILIGCTGVLIYRVMRRHEMAAMAMPPLFIGMSLLLIGNFMSVLPGNIFPFDTLSGILNAGCLFYALYRKRMFKLTLLVSRGSIFAVSIASMSVLFAFEIQYLEAAIDKYIPLLAPYSTLAIALIFVAFSLSLFALLSRVIDNLFIKDELRQAEKLRQFSVSISKSLNLEEIMGQIISLVSEIVEVEKIYLCLHDESSNRYHVAASASPLDARIFSLSAENPCVTWLREHGSCLLLREFSRTPQYKAMWEQEKRQLAELDASCLVPLSSDDELVGILILTQKYKNSAFTYDDISFLESAQSIVSIAIKNANLYEKAYYESRIDHLTGLLNRKFFYERINEEFGKNSGGSLALVILNLDDFKLYNQLYGNREGDEALQNVANIIRTSLGKQGFAARYGGKEFAIVLPGFDTYKALGLARDIRQQIISMNKQSGAQVLKVLTLSGGVCVYPYAASTVTQLVGNADMAVYNAKRSGKNKILA